ncbi:MAG: 50S ribosomal protein L13 [candidate division WWE3 bacterium]|nr:50S ribosomal protein L13 [candidate division WWE3 bacterium]
METRTLSSKEIIRNNVTIDASTNTLGRIASEAARYLLGKGKVLNASHLVNSDVVTVINASKVQITGNKLINKIYVRHSGFPKGLKEESLERLLKRDPAEVIRQAVLGMLPKNKLRNDRIKYLKIFCGSKNGRK